MRQFLLRAACICMLLLSTNYSLSAKSVTVPLDPTPADGDEEKNPFGHRIPPAPVSALIDFDIVEPNYFYYNGRTKQITSVTIKENPHYYGEIPEELKIAYLRCEGTGVPQPNRVTTLTVTAENVVNQSRLDAFLNSTDTRLVTSFSILGYKGQVIQTFNVPIIK